MRILSAGMNRSGSTWLYNALRLMVERDYVRGFVSGNDTPLNVKNALIKIHGINEDYIKWADYIFYTYRDIRDVVASLVRRTGEIPPESKINNNMMAWNRYVVEADLVIEYNRIINEPEKVISDIGKIIGIKPDIEMILKELNEMKNKKLKNTDPVTLMRINHVTDGRSGIYKKDLDSDFIDWIEKKYRCWLLTNDYMERD